MKLENHIQIERNVAGNALDKQTGTERRNKKVEHEAPHILIGAIKPIEFSKP
jgi:hypothetical protein